MGETSPAIPSFALYGEPFGNAFPDILHCETIVDRSGLHDWTIRPHRHHGLHQFLILRGGGVTVTSDGQRHELVAPAALMNAPGAVHGFRFEPDTAGLCVTAPSAMLARSLSGNPALLACLDRSLYVDGPALGDDLPDLSAIFDGLARDYAVHREGRAEALLCRLGLVALWFAGIAERRASAEALRHEIVDRFLQLVEEKFRQQLPVAFYARRLGLSAAHLTRLCRRQLGLSALGVVHDRVMLEAKRNFVYTGGTIAGIATDLGFSDPSYFTKLFVQRAGITPKAFRRRFEPSAGVE